MESDKKYLIEVADGLDRAEREGKEYDVPEGTRNITMSDTLAKEIANRLRIISERM